jgi:hypothetical protein
MCSHCKMGLIIKFGDLVQLLQCVSSQGCWLYIYSCLKKKLSGPEFKKNVCSEQVQSEIGRKKKEKVRNIYKFCACVYVNYVLESEYLFVVFVLSMFLMTNP